MIEQIWLLMVDLIYFGSITFFILKYFGKTPTIMNITNNFTEKAVCEACEKELHVASEGEKK